MSTRAWKPKFVLKIVQNLILSIARVSVHLEKKLPWLHQYQSYISNWYINGKVFTSTTASKPKNLLFFSRKFEIDFWLVSKSWILQSFVNTSLTLVFTSTYYINGKVFTSTYYNMKRLITYVIIWFYSPKKFEIEFWLVFCLTCFFLKFEIEFWLVSKSWSHSNS